MSEKEWPGLPYLESLRPDVGWRADFALLTTYSLDLVALVAALLAVAGLDDERGSGSKVDLASAIDSLKGRVRVMVQSGCTAVPAKTGKILGILDQFVRDVRMDEAEGSWHPKVALVRFVTDVDSVVEWSLWLGSRNLTRDLSWDAGLAITGREGGSGTAIPGVAELGRELAERAGLPGVVPEEVFRELQGTSWEMPKGANVEEVNLYGNSERGIPPQPEGVWSLTVISPFLDGTVINELGRWGDESTYRALMSSEGELKKLAGQKGRPLDGFADLLSLAASDPTLFDLPEAEQEDSEGSDDEEPEPRGLHAKLIYAEHRGGRTLWLGSANATQRGWKGPNSEAVARVSVNRRSGEGIDTFIREIGRTVNLDEVSEVEESEEDERLEAARREVAARWDVVLQVRDSRAILTSANRPHPVDREIELSVGFLGQPRVKWPRGVKDLELPPAAVADLTEFVCCELALGKAKQAWVQHTEMDPPLGDDRDRRALARYLDPRTFLLWVRSLLAGAALVDGGGAWDAPPRKDLGGAHGVGPDWWAPTLEEVLKAWTRNPEIVVDVDRKVQRYLKVLAEESPEALDEKEEQLLTDFRRTWAVLRSELVVSQS